MDNPPLVRTKKKGQKGEDRNIRIYLTFNISDRMRRQFAQVWQMGSGGIHRNGPIGTHWELNGAIDGDKIHIANVPQWQTQMRPGEYIIQARGNEQTEDFSQDAIAVNTMEHWAFWVKPRELAPLVNDAIAKSFRIPVRDWRQPGIALTYTLMTHGSGVEPLPDGGSMKWTINRSVNGTSRLTQELPMPMLPSRGNPQSRATGPTPGRFISWMADPTQPSRLPNAIIEDEFVWKRKAEKECGEEPIDPNIEYSETTKDLPHPSATSPMSFGFYQFDKTDKTASLNVFANSQPPVEIRRLNTPVQRTQMSVFQDITFDANPSTPHLQLPDKVIDFPLTAGTGASGLPGYRQVRIPLSGTATTKKHGITGTANLRVSGEIMIYIPATGGPRPNLATVQRATRYALAMLAQNGSGAKPRH